MAADGDVVGCPRGAAQRVDRVLLEAPVVARARGDRLRGRRERAVQPRGLRALGRREVAVARGEREPVVRARGLAGDDRDRQGELRHHALDDAQLLVVLLAEHRGLRLHDVEELQHHRAHAVEEPAPELALEDVAELGRRRDLVALRNRVHLALVGREHDVDARALELRAVGGEGARVGVEVLVRGELQPVHEDRRHRAVAVTLRDAHEPEVALVQVAHGRHAGHRAPAQRAAELGDGGDDLHWNACSGPGNSRAFTAST